MGRDDLLRTYHFRMLGLSVHFDGTECGTPKTASFIVITFDQAISSANKNLI